MLDFVEYLVLLDSKHTERYVCEDDYDISPYICKYLIAMQNSKKRIKLDNDVYKSLINFLGRGELEKFWIL